MSGGPFEIDPEQAELTFRDYMDFIERTFGMGQAEFPPPHVYDQEVQLSDENRSVRATIPHYAIRDNGLDEGELPTVKCYYDPIFQIAFFDLGGRFD